MGWYLLIDRKWDRVVLKQVADDQNEDDATLIHEEIIGSDTNVVVAADQLQVQPDSDGRVRVSM